jgi:HNH endonuclease/Helix-turn-helix domain of resolvase
MKLCECGCGQPAPIATMTNRKRGIKAGEPYRFIRNHSKRVPLSVRFWAKVRKSDGCWEWTGAHRPNGYGSIQINDEAHSTHRVSWELTHGLIPHGLCVLHRCDNPACVRPDHLFLGTHQDNTIDALQKERRGGDRHWLRKNPKAVAGERNPAAKLTPTQVAEIRQRHAQGGITQRTLAREYGVSKSTVSYVVTGHTW